MYLVGSEQMREMDRFTIQRIGIPGVVLMENAGAAVAREIESRWRKGRRVVVLCGYGNNGGDGFVAARHLANRGYVTTTWLLGDPEKLSEDSRTHYRALQGCGYPVNVVGEPTDRLLQEIGEAEIVVDALLGTGVRGEVRPAMFKLIEAVNESAASVVSVDIPSGVDADSGRILGICVRADLTVTFAYPKWGHYLYPGAEARGELVVADISLPPRLEKTFSLSSRLITPEIVSLPPRSPNSHKGTYGHLLVIAGSRDMPGAPALAAMAAVRSGVGLVTLAVPESVRPVVAAKVTEPILWTWEESAEGTFALASASKLQERAHMYSCMAVGPGIRLWKEGEEWLRRILQTYEGPVVLDADALNLLARNPAILSRRRAAVVLTPHPGEMGRLLGKTAAEVEAQRPQTALEAAQRFQSYVVLKGRFTLIATPDGRLYVNPSGNAALAKGGSGDVLTGMIGAFIAQGLDVEKAVINGVYLHGLAGELSGKTSLYSSTASDVIQQIGAAIRNVSK
ncbi:NAD(P)H-hydrate dehydratase [Bacillaceae bacterium]